MEGTDHAVLAELGQRLAKLRLDRNITQAALADEAGVSLATLKRLEAGHSVQLTSWLRVLRALGLQGGLDALIPDPARSPMQQLRQVEGRRKRASSRPAAPPEGWAWGDER